MACADSWLAASILSAFIGGSISLSTLARPLNAETRPESTQSWAFDSRVNG
jgi:hypothetical protein